VGQKDFFSKICASGKGKQGTPPKKRIIKKTVATILRRNKLVY